MHPSWNNHQVLTYLEQQIKNHNLKYAEDYEAMTKEQQRRNAWNESHIAEKGNERKSITFIDRISKLSHPNLKRYIYKDVLTSRLLRSSVRKYIIISMINIIMP